MAPRLPQALAMAVLAAAVSPALSTTAAAERRARVSVSGAETMERGRVAGRCGVRNIRKLMAALSRGEESPPATEPEDISAQERDCAAASLEPARAARLAQGLAGIAASVGAARSPTLVGGLRQLYREGDVEALQLRGRRAQEETATGRQLNKVLERAEQDAQGLAGGPDRLREVERRAAAGVSSDGVLRHESCKQLPLQEEGSDRQNCLARAEIRDYKCDIHRRVSLLWQGNYLICPNSDPVFWVDASYDEGGRQDRVGLRVPCELPEEGKMPVDFAATEAWRLCGSTPIYQRRQLQLDGQTNHVIAASFGNSYCQTVQVEARLECGLGGEAGRCRVEAAFSRLVEVPAPPGHRLATLEEWREIGSVAVDFDRPQRVPLISASWDESNCSLFDGLAGGS